MKQVLSAGWLVVRDAYGRFTRHGCPIMAAATAFYSLLSLVPLALLAISIFGRVLGEEAAQERVVGLLQGGLPGASKQLEAAIRAIASRESRWFVNLVGVFALLWSGTSLLANLAMFLTVAWTGQASGRTFVRRRLVALVAILTAGLFFLLSIVFTSVMSAVGAWSQQAGAVWSSIEHHSTVMEWALSGVVATGVFFLLYRFLPAARVSSGAALLGAVCAAVLWHISRGLFAVLVANSSRYGQIYGPLAGAVILMLWIYYSALILFICAEIAAAYQDHSRADAVGDEVTAPPRSNRERGTDTRSERS